MHQKNMTMILMFVVAVLSVLVSVSAFVMFSRGDDIRAQQAQVSKEVPTQ